MATTRLSDVIVPEVFTPYSMQRSLQLSALYQSGIIVNNPYFDRLASGDGATYNMPFFRDLSGDSNVSSDDPTQRSVPNKIGTGQDVAMKHFRNQSWASMDLVAALMTPDPMRVIADRVGAYWARESQKILIAQLTGVVAANVANNGSDMVLDITSPGTDPVTDANRISAQAVILAAQTLGDASAGLTTMVVHSAVHARLSLQNLIETVPPSEANVAFERYLGKRIITDDSMPATIANGKITYTSYLFGPGAVALGQGQPKTPEEVERDPSSGNGEGQDILHSRRHFIMHLGGVKWTDAARVGASPTSAELANPANYSRVYDRKAIRFVAIRTNG